MIKAKTRENFVLCVLRVVAKGIYTLLRFRSNKQSRNASSWGNTNLGGGRQREAFCFIQIIMKLHFSLFFRITRALPEAPIDLSTRRSEPPSTRL